MSSPKSASRIDHMEKLAVVLSLPRRNKYNALPEVERPPGLPINALPGWESIPLHSKLPMLKCPDNQVIFSKNKIGRSYETWQRDFDSVCLNAKMDYNPLHDPHLRIFYSNEKLLKRLRDNGEITQNNDVICTLKQFNEHRIPLHETYLSLIRIERNRLNDDKRDKQMIAHAEKIAEWERRMTERRSKGAEFFGDMHVRKAELSMQRAQRIQALRLRSQRKTQQIETMRAIRAVVLRQKKELHDFNIKHRLDVGLDIQRKRLIALKKHLQFKSDRLKNNIKFIKENTFVHAKEKARQSWEMHLKERIIKHEHIKQITKENEMAMNEWISNHMEHYKQKWDEIQTQLDNRCRRHQKKRPRKKRTVKNIRHTLPKSDDDGLKNLTSQDIHDALETAIDLEDPRLVKQYDVDDCIYKAAKYIIEDILSKFDKDLSGEAYLACALASRISTLFTEVKHYVIKRASQIIASEEADGDHCGVPRMSIVSRTRGKRFSLLKFVSFNSFSALIGKGSYKGSEMKTTAGRLPTPAGSLTSVVIEPDGTLAESVRKQRSSIHQLTRDEQIFIEHLFIKFKRELTVGIGRQVLAAIECHKHNKILDVRKELQDIDKAFLVKIMARSILSYAINSCNFHSNTLLCQYALAGDIIMNLQKGLLKPVRDPRNRAQPHSRCVCAVVPPFWGGCNECGKQQP